MKLACFIDKKGKADGELNSGDWGSFLHVTAVCVPKSEFMQRE
jgi:hypothetical protein